MNEGTRPLRAVVLIGLLGVLSVAAAMLPGPAWAGLGHQVTQARAAVPAVAGLAPTTTIGPAGQSLDYFQCGIESETCFWFGEKYVAYGANGSFIFKSITDSRPCTNETFGGDPAVGVVKACYFANYRLSAGENHLGRLPSGTPFNVAYGANGVFNFRTLSGDYNCDNTTFGDPIAGVVKACYLPLPDYNFGAVEAGVLSGLNNTPVAYGANGHFVYQVRSGSMPCTNEEFGTDPAVGTVKLCYRMDVPFIADEGGSYSVDAQFVAVLYGSGLNGSYLRSSAHSGPCTNTAFGGDPDVGVFKHCFGEGIVG
jgi:hypothetical protein